jgi:catechol 2,3-dioxygenase-like lactoylglutathione lyase family enzyme
MIQTKGLAHFTIPVTDTERSQEFYERHLGMKFLGGGHQRGMIFLDAGGDCVILARVDKAASTARLEDVHHAFIVDHDAYTDAVQELRDNGVDVFFEEDREGGVVNGPRAYFHDPDGNVLEIIDLTSYSGAE